MIGDAIKRTRDISLQGKKLVLKSREDIGDFRLIGIMSYSGNISDTEGYMILDVKKMNCRVFSPSQTKVMISKYRFENAILDDKGAIKCTECAMGSLFIYANNGAILKNKGFTILAQIVVDGECIGYSVITHDGVIREFSTNMLLSAIDNNSSKLVNAKVVKRQGSESFISAIKGNFKIIEKQVEKAVDTTVSKADKELKEYYKEESKVESDKHRLFLKKILKGYIDSFCTRGAVNLNVDSTEGMRRAKIFIKEYALVKYPEVSSLSAIDIRDILNVVVGRIIVDKGIVAKKSRSKILLGSGGRSGKKETWYSRLHSKSLSPECYENGLLKNCKDLTDYFVARDSLITGVIIDGVTSFDNKNEVFYGLLHSFVSMPYKKTIIRNKKLKASKLKNACYDTAKIEYNDELGLNKMGYTLYPDSVGTPFFSPIYGDIKLRNFFDGLDIDIAARSKFTGLVNTFGDREFIYKLKESAKAGYWNYMQVQLGILSIFNNALAHEILNYFVNSGVIKLDARYLYELDALVTDMSELSKKDYSEDILTYYNSGGKFNRSVELTYGSNWGTGKSLNSKKCDNRGSLCAVPHYLLLVIRSKMNVSLSLEDDLSESFITIMRALGSFGVPQYKLM